MIARLSKQLPLAAKFPQKPTEPAVSSASGKSVSASKLALDREALFLKKDVNQDGKLSREEFMVNQPDPDSASARFTQWDTIDARFLSRQGFVNKGEVSK